MLGPVVYVILCRAFEEEAHPGPLWGTEEKCHYFSKSSSGVL